MGRATPDVGAPTSPRAEERSATPSRAWARLDARTATLLYAALAVAYVLPALGSARQLGGSDYTAAGYMVLEFVSRLIAAGELPSWLPDIMGGVPLFANPGSTFHPVRLVLALVLPMAAVLPVLFAVHFTLAGVGTFLLLRDLGARAWIAFVAGLAYEFTGTLASLLYAGHDGRFIVAASAPLFLFCLARGVQRGSRGALAGAAAVLGSAMLSFQLQSAYYLLLAGAAWTLFALVSAGLHRRPALMVRRGAGALAAVAVAFALAAVNFLPFADYVEASPRAASVGRGYDFATSFSMPLVETIGFAVPEQTGVLGTYRGENPIKLHTEYAGALVVALVALGLLVTARDRRWQFFAAAAAVALTISWGGHTPIYRLYYALLPGTTKFRAPSIALYVSVLGFVVMAGLALERLATLRDEPSDTARRRRRAARRLLGGLVGVSVLVWLTQSVSGPASAAAAAGWLRFSVCLAVVAGIVALWLEHRLPTATAAALLAVSAVADLWVVDRRFLLLVDRPEVLYAADDVVNFLRRRRDLGRVWVFSSPVPGDNGGYLGNGSFGAHTNYLMRFGFPQVGGEHGNQLQRWNEYGGLGPGNQLVDWHNLVRSGAMRSAAAVRYVISRVDLSQMRTADGQVVPSGMRRVYRGSAMVFRNEFALPRAYLVPSIEVAPSPNGTLAMLQRETWDPRRTVVVDAPLPGIPLGATLPPGLPSVGLATITADRPDSVVVRASVERPAVLVLADNYYPGWVATVDGAPAAVHRVNHTFRGVVLTPGEHEIHFAFRPPALRVGLWISLAAALGLTAYALVPLAMRVRRPGADGAARAAATP